MNSRSVRLLGRLGAMALIAALAIPLAGIARGADNTFVLNSAGSRGAPGGTASGNYDQTFAGVEIRATPDPATGMYKLEANDFKIPLSWDWGDAAGKTVTGTGSFAMHGTYDPKANAVTGTFTMEQEATGKLVYKVGTYSLKFALIWKGDVTGSVENNVAQLYFSGTDTVVCSLGGDDCGYTGTQGERVWFDVSNANYTVVPGSTPGEAIAVVVSGATGDVYYSPADQADLAPADRTWTIVKPGDRIALDEGVMLRTGGNSSLKVEFTTGARFRLQPSTLFGVKKIENMRTPTSQWTMYGRLYEGIAWFYMEKWKEDHRGFEVETDRANTSIQGTTYEIAVTASATVVTVTEGVVAVTDNATGTVVDVGPGERATVDATGMTKTATPAASAGPSSAPPATASPTDGPPASAAASATAAVSPATETGAPTGSALSAVAAPASPATLTAAPAGSGTGSGGSDPPIGILAAIIAGILVVAVVAVGLLRRTPRT